MKFCPECGKPCDGAKFCPECGFDLRPYLPVVDSITPPEPPPPPTTATIGTAQPAPTQPANIEALLAPFNWTKNENSETYTIKSVKDRSIRNADIPHGVTNIGAMAFCCCYSLAGITIPNTVTYIEDSAFSECPSLTHIQVEKSNPVYHSSNQCLIETATQTLVAGCKNSIIPSDGSVTTIGKMAFCACTSLTSITIPNTVRSIEYAAFANCTSLKNITIPNSVTSICAGVFDGCEALTSITIPNSVAFIEASAFMNCHALKTAYIPKHTQFDDEYSFPSTCQIIRT